MATRCFYGGYIWAQVNWTQLSTTLGHKMPLLGGTSDFSSGSPDPMQYHFWPLGTYTGEGVHLTDLITYPREDYRLHINNNKKDQSTYAQYFPLQFLRTNIHWLWQTSQISILLHCNVQLTSSMAEHQMRKKTFCTHNPWNLVMFWSPNASTGSMSELRSTGPNLVPVLATRCLYWRYIWAQVNQT